MMARSLMRILPYKAGGHGPPPVYVMATRHDEGGPGWRSSPPLGLLSSNFQGFGFLIPLDILVLTHSLLLRLWRLVYQHGRAPLSAADGGAQRRHGKSLSSCSPDSSLMLLRSNSSSLSADHAAELRLALQSAAPAANFRTGTDPLMSEFRVPLG